MIFHKTLLAKINKSCSNSQSYSCNKLNLFPIFWSFSISSPSSLLSSEYSSSSDSSLSIFVAKLRKYYYFLIIFPSVCVCSMYHGKSTVKMKCNYLESSATVNKTQYFRRMPLPNQLLKDVLVTPLHSIRRVFRREQSETESPCD